jgi:hypothetical protein
MQHKQTDHRVTTQRATRVGSNGRVRKTVAVLIPSLAVAGALIFGSTAHDYDKITGSTEISQTGVHA